MFDPNNAAQQDVVFSHMANISVSPEDELPGRTQKLLCSPAPKGLVQGVRLVRAPLEQSFGRIAWTLLALNTEVVSQFKAEVIKREVCPKGEGGSPVRALG